MNLPVPHSAALALLGLLACAGSGTNIPREGSGNLEIRIRGLSSGTASSLRGLMVVSDRVVWATGSAGTFLVTGDGGDTWRTGQIPGCESRDLRDVYAFGPLRAIVVAVGEPAQLWTTDDGGESWRCVYTDAREGMFLDSLDFWPNGRGLCFGDPVDGTFTVLVSDRDAARWQQVPSEALPVPMAGEAGFAASGTLVRCLPGGVALVATGGGSARVLLTEDYGQHWEAVSTPMRQGTPSSGCFSLLANSNGYGALVGGDYSDAEARMGTAAYSADGGRTWAASREPLPPYRSCVAEAPCGSPPWWIAVGKGGASLSQDRGHSWAPFALPGHYAIAFAPNTVDGWTVGFLAGSEGRVTRVELRPEP